MRIDLVQPYSFSPTSFAGGHSTDGPGEEANLETAEAFVFKSAESGVDLVVFPELFPGPTSKPEGCVSFE